MACDLEVVRITSLPADAFYISDFISDDEEARLLHKVSVICDTLALMNWLASCIVHISCHTESVLDTSFSPAASCTACFYTH